MGVVRVVDRERERVGVVRVVDRAREGGIVIVKSGHVLL